MDENAVAQLPGQPGVNRPAGGQEHGHGLTAAVVQPDVLRSGRGAGFGAILLHRAGGPVNIPLSSHECFDLDDGLPYLGQTESGQADQEVSRASPAQPQLEAARPEFLNRFRHRRDNRGVARPRTGDRRAHSYAFGILKHLGHDHVDVSKKGMGVDEAQAREARVFTTPGEIHNLGDGFG